MNPGEGRYGLNCVKRTINVLVMANVIYVIGSCIKTTGLCNHFSILPAESLFDEG